jgi:hypothetical protein
MEGIENIIIEPEPDTPPTTPPLTTAPATRSNFRIVENIPTLEIYRKGELNLAKYTIPELKYISAYYDLYTSGTKTTIIDRIQSHFEKILMVIKIQSVWRRHLVKLLFSLRGDAVLPRTRKSTVNDIDFYTFENIAEIPFELFFSFRDESFLYGFNIESLILLISKNVGSHTITNPYTRTEITDNTIHDIFQYIRLNHIFYPEIKLIDERIFNLIYSPIVYKKKRGGGGAHTPSSGADAAHKLNDDMKVYLQQTNIIKKIQDFRAKDIQTRIVNIFMEIDLLGNYTIHSWFSRLNLNNTIVYWNCLYDIWLYRAGIIEETKRQICPIHPPFYNKLLFNFPPAELTLEITRDYCLYAMENVIYMSTNEEFRKLGATYVIMALTVVSTDARRAFPWLYESIQW